jgi:kumamolisin
VLKPGAPLRPAGPRLTRAEYAATYGTHQSVIDQVSAYARRHGLTVESADASAHLLKLFGTYAQAMAAFRPDRLGRFRLDGREVICRSGHLHVPPDLTPHIVAVMGFDQRPMARTHFRIRPPASGTISYDPAAVARRYDFPSNATGAGQTIALIELGGGYDPMLMAQYFTAKNVPRTGTLEAISVDGASTTPIGSPNGPDGEVQLDVEIAGSVAPGANIAVYFGNNQSASYLDTISAAIHDSQRAPSVISLSWGGPETGWSAQDLAAFDQAFQTAASLGITVCAASGDRGATDGSPDGSLTVDFPAASPHVLGCGGTSLPQAGPETGWNDGSGGGASGGGYSARFPRPDWQSGNPQAGRGVPDVAGDADPRTGYNVTLDGEDAIGGGTSTVAPLWAGLIARANQALGKNAGFVNPVLYAAPAAFTDITIGSNNGYSCAPGWDPVTGLGTPKGGAILAALKRT